MNVTKVIMSLLNKPFLQLEANQFYKNSAYNTPLYISFSKGRGAINYADLNLEHNNIFYVVEILNITPEAAKLNDMYYSCKILCHKGVFIIDIHNPSDEFYKKILC